MVGPTAPSVDWLDLSLAKPSVAAVVPAPRNGDVIAAGVGQVDGASAGRSERSNRQRKTAR